MTQFQIDEQIKVIERATEKALKSKETALKFLTDAGIIKANGNSNSKKKNQ